MRVVDYVIDRIYKEGVDHIFLVTGGGSMYLNDAIATHGKIKPICNHHEQASAMSAVGYAKYTNNLSAVCITSGCGGTNTITGVLEAWQDSVPVIFVSGNVNKQHMGRNKVRTLGPQEAHIVDIVKSITKYSVVVEESSEIESVMTEAIRIATTGRPGPVWIDIPLDIQGSTYIDPCNYVAELLSKAERPLIIAGNGINCAKGRKEFIDFVNKSQIPVATTYNGIDLISSDHPRFVGRVGIKATRAGNFAMQNSDLLLVIGCRLPVSVTGYNYNNFAREAKVVVVDIDENEHSKNTINIHKFINMDAKKFLDCIKFETLEISEWATKCLRWRNDWPVCLEKNDGDKVNLYYFMERLNNLKRSDDVVVADAGSAFYVCAQTTSIKDQQRYVTSSSQGDMGFTLPACIGVSLAKGGDVIGISGDGSLPFNVQELQTIIHHNLPVKLFVWNNDAYLSIKNTQDKFFEGRRIGTNSESGISLPSVEKIAYSYGIHYMCANAIDLDERIIQTINYDGPVICEVMCQIEQQVIPTLTGKMNSDGTITPKPLEDLYPFLPRDEFYANMIIKPLEE
jgi:acetolactate synthase-1/2/3 large subunit